MNPSRSRRQFPRVLATSVAALLGLAVTAMADSATWTGLNGNSWTDNGNWTANFPNANTDVATFDGTGLSTIPTITSTTITVGEIIFTNTAVAQHTITLDASGSGTSLTFETTGVTNNSATTHIFSTGTGGQTASFIFNNSASAGGNNVAYQINSNGVLQFNGTSSAGTAGVTIDGGITDFNNSSTANNGTFVVNNGGTLSFNDSSTASSATITINTGGSLIFKGTATGGTVTVSNASGGIFDISQQSGGVSIGAISGDGNFRLGGNTLTVGSNGTPMTVSGVIQDGGLGGGSGASLVKTGASTLTLTGPNAYTGTTNVADGTLILSAGGSISTASAVDLTGGAAKFDVSGVTPTSVTIASLAGVANSEVVLGGKNLIVGGSSASTTFSGIISGAGGTLNKVGFGTLTLQGVNTYTGTTTIETGTLALSGAGALNSAGAVVLVSSGNTFRENGDATFDISAMTASSQTISSLTSAADGLIVLGSKELIVGDATSTTVAGVIEGAGGSLTKQGSGTLTLSGANTYSGLTTINAGKITLGAGGSLSDLTAVNTAAAGTTLDISGISNNGEKIGSLAGATGSSVILGSKNLVTGGNGGNTTFGGVISGTGNFFKEGAGTMVVTGVNTYSGATVVTGGTFNADTTTNATVLNSASALVVGGGKFLLTGAAGTDRIQIMNGLTVDGGNSVIEINVVGNSTTLDLRGTSGTQTITHLAGGTVDFRTTIPGDLGTTGRILTAQQNNSAGIIGSWATVNQGTGFASVDANGVIVAFNGYADIGALGPIPVPNGVNLVVRINSMGTAGPVPLSQPTTSIHSLTQNFTTASTIDTTNGTLRVGVDGGIFINKDAAALTIGTAATATAGNLTAGGTANTSGNLTLGNFSASALTINAHVTDNGSGVVSLTKTGSGTVTLTNTNTYTGATIIGDGLLSMTGLATLSAETSLNLTGATAKFDMSGITATEQTVQWLNGVAGSTVNLGGKRLIIKSDGTNVEYAGVISGAGGSLTKTGTGSQTLSGNNTFTGGVTLDGGTLITNSNTALGTNAGTLTITNSATTKTLGSSVEGITIANPIAMNGDVSIGTAAFNYTLSGAINFGGGTRTITGFNHQNQIHFAGTFANGGVTLKTSLTNPGEYVAFILDSGFVNSATGLMTLDQGAFLVLQNTGVNSGVAGDLLITGNAVIDYLGDGIVNQANQIADTATVTVNSQGNTIPSGNGVQQFAGFDMFNASGTELIGTLNGNGLIWLNNASLSVTGGNFSGNIADGGHGITGGDLIKRGAGTLTLSGVSSHTGNTDITGGKIALTGNGTLGNGTSLRMSNSTIFDISGISGTSASAGSLATTANTDTAASVVLGSKNLTVGANNTSTTFAGVISGTDGSLTKTGTGTMTLINVNTYTGATTVNGGTLNASFGTNSSILSSSSTLVLGGGTFQLTGTAGATKVQVMDGLTLNGGSNVIDVSNNGGTSTTLDLRGPGGTKAFTRNGGTIDFRASTGTFSTNAIVMTNQQNDASGIIGAWATVNGGAAFAANDGTGKIVAFTNYVDISARAGGAPPAVIPNTDPNAHVRIQFDGVAGNITLAAPVTTINTLTQNTDTAAIVDLGGAAGVLRLGQTGGIFIAANNAALTIGTAANVGSITAGGTSANTAAELILGNFNSAGGAVLTINAAITNNGFGDVTLTKTGTGVVVLAGTNTYQGDTNITGGELRLTGAGSLSNQTGVNLTNSGTIFNISAINAANETIGSLSGVVGSSVNLGGKELTAGGNGRSTTFAGVISGTGTFTKEGSGTLTFTGQNSYSGQTTVNAGTLILNTSAGNALAGNLMISGGKVVLQQSNQILDSKTIVVADNGTFDIGANSEILAGVTLVSGSILGTTGLLTSASTFDVRSGTITADLNGSSNSVGLDKTTSGTVTLAGSNSYRGVTNVNGGTLILDGVINGGLNGVNVTNGSEFDVTGNGIVVVGDGVTVVKATDGNTVNNAGLLQGGNNSTGIIAANKNTIINSGAIIGGSVGFKGVVLTGSENFVANSGFISADKAIIASNATGSNLAVNYGSLIGNSGTAVDSTTSTGNFAFTNVSEVTGDVRFGVGDDIMTIATKSTVSGVIDGGAGTNALRLVGGGTDTLEIGTDRIVGFVSLYKGGGGTWNLTGEGTFVNGTIVQEGNLLVQGNLISDVIVQTGGLLGGTGLITGNVINFGIVSPGNSPGVMTIKGNYDQRDSGTLEIEIQGKKDGQHDVLKIGGTARLSGTLRIKNAGHAPAFRMGDKVTFLIADGGVQGTFKKVENPFRTDTIIKTDIEYEANTVSLVAAQGSYEEFARTHELTKNQRATAKAIDGAIAAGINAKMVDYLNNRPLGRIPEELDRIAPDELGAIYRVGIGLANVQNQNIQRRTDDLRLSNRRVNTANFQATGSAPVYSGQMAGGVAGPQGDGPITRPPDRRWGAFLSGMGEWIRIGDTDNARGYDFSTGGVTVGADYRVNDHLAVGLSAGYAGTSAQLPGRGEMEVNGGKVGAYATYYDGKFYVDAAVSGGYNSYETRRAGLQGSARGRTEGSEINAMIGTGYDWSLESLTLGALTSVEYTYLGFDGFKEDGSLAPLRYPDQSAQSLRTKVGIKVVYDWHLGKVLMRPELRAIWQHEFASRSFPIESGFVSGGNLFTVDDPAVGRDSLLLGLGTSVFLGERATTYLYYDGELYRKESDSHNVSGGVRISF